MRSTRNGADQHRRSDKGPRDIAAELPVPCVVLAGNRGTLGDYPRVELTGEFIKAILPELELRDAVAQGLPLGTRRSGLPGPRPTAKDVRRRRSIRPIHGPLEPSRSAPISGFHQFRS